MNAPSPSGLVVVDKPGALTSHDVVARVRRLAGTRKVGHAGTLDPMATGVLVLGVNRATRLLGHLMLTEKAYAATIRLGVSTVTDDAEGDVLARVGAEHVGDDEIAQALQRFVGDIEQVPTAVSAIKVDGKRAYQRVRDGEQVHLKARPVTVHELTAGTPRRGDGVVDVDVELRCSSGTYVRALARDLGSVLGVGGHLTALRRTAVGGFGLDVASSLEQLAEEFTMIPIAQAARASFTSYDLGEEQAADVRIGRALELELPAQPTALFDPSGEFLALYEQRGPQARALAVFV